MSFLKRIKKLAIADRLIEEKLYEQVLHELEAGVRRDGLWAKALQNSYGDEQKAIGLYIKYRVQSVKDEEDNLRFLAEQHVPETMVQTPSEIEKNTAKATQIPCKKNIPPKYANRNRKNFKKHNGPETQCKTCGFIAFNTDPYIARHSKCLGCGNTMGFSKYDKSW